MTPQRHVSISSFGQVWICVGIRLCQRLGSWFLPQGSQPAPSNTELLCIVLLLSAFLKVDLIGSCCERNHFLGSGLSPPAAAASVPQSQQQVSWLALANVANPTPQQSAQSIFANQFKWISSPCLPSPTATGGSAWTGLSCCAAQTSLAIVQEVSEHESKLGGEDGFCQARLHSETGKTPTSDQ